MAKSFKCVEQSNKALKTFSRCAEQSNNALKTFSRCAEQSNNALKNFSRCAEQSNKALKNFFRCVEQSDNALKNLSKCCKLFFNWILKSKSGHQILVLSFCKRKNGITIFRNLNKSWRWCRKGIFTLSEIDCRVLLGYS